MSEATNNAISRSPSRAFDYREDDGAAEMTTDPSPVRFAHRGVDLQSIADQRPESARQQRGAPPRGQGGAAAVKC